MEVMHILFGCEVPAYANAVKKLLRTKGYDAKIHVRQSKRSIKEFLANNKACNTVVIKETFPSDAAYTAEEVAQLTDLRDVNVIMVLSEKHKGTEYMSTLYSAGVVNAIFQGGKNDGGSVKEVATLILQRRTRKAAREYYGIASKKIELGFLDNATFSELYEKLKKEDTEDKNYISYLLKNYIEICGRLSPQQIEDFTKRLPQNDIDELLQFSEFHTIMQLLKKFGINMGYKKPRKVTLGLNTHVGIELHDEQIVVEGMKQPEIKEDEATVSNHNDVDDNTGNIEEMSLAELFGVPGASKEEKGNEPIMETETSKHEVDDLESLSLADLFGIKSNDGLKETVDESVGLEVTEKMDVYESVAEKKQEPEKTKQDKEQRTSSEKMINESSDFDLKNDPIAELEEEETAEEIVFEDYDEEFDNLSLDSDNKRFSLPYVAVIGVFVVVVCALFVMSGSSVVLF